MSFSKIFQILFIVGSTFLIFIPEYLNNSWWCFSSSFSTFEDRRRVPLQSNPFSQRCVVLTCCRPLIIVLSVRILFTHPEQFRSLFSLILWNSSSQNYSFSAFSSRSRILPVHHSSIIQSARDLCVHLYLNSLKYLRSFSNSSRCFFIFSSFIFNSYGGSFKSSLPSLSYRFIRSFQSYRWFVEDLPKFAPYLS